jgi:hypothetical protein
MGGSHEPRVRATGWAQRDSQARHELRNPLTVAPTKKRAQVGGVVQR